MSKDRHILERDQRIGAAILLVLLLGAMVVVNLISRHKANSLNSNIVADSLITTSSIQSERVIYLHPFDPNTADSVELAQIGLEGWQIRNMMKYRSKGGRYRKKEDFARLYGLSDSAYHAMESYICIAVSPEEYAREQRWKQDSLRRDSVNRQYQYKRDSVHAVWDSIRRADSMQWLSVRKIKKDTILDLNTADTAQLQMIRGIGRYTAMEIVRYRYRLGGYISVEQLHDLAKKDAKLAALDTLTQFFVVSDSANIRLLPVNRSSVERLRSHPYLTFTQAKAIYEQRRRKVRLRCMDDLRELSEFSESDLRRIEPYLSFE